MQKIKALISDADGTLVDTVSLIRHGQYEAAKQYLTNHGIPEDEIPDYDSYEVHLNQAVGGKVRDTLEKTMRLLYAESPHHLETIDFDELAKSLGPVQDRLAKELVTQYAGFSSLLDMLGKHSIKLAIFTSGSAHHMVRNFGVALPELGLENLYTDTTKTDEEKLTIFTQAVMEKHNLQAFTIVTAGDTTQHKPHPESLLLAMERLGVTTDQVAVLGDHTVDMQAAINADVNERVGITHGFDDRKTLETAGASLVVDSLTELADILEEANA